MKKYILILVIAGINVLNASGSEAVTTELSEDPTPSRSIVNNTNVLMTKIFSFLDLVDKNNTRVVSSYYRAMVDKMNILYPYCVEFSTSTFLIIPGYILTLAIRKKTGDLYLTDVDETGRVTVLDKNNTLREFLIENNGGINYAIFDRSEDHIYTYFLRSHSIGKYPISEDGNFQTITQPAVCEYGMQRDMCLSNNERYLFVKDYHGITSFKIEGTPEHNLSACYRYQSSCVKNFILLKKHPEYLYASSDYQLEILNVADPENIFCLPRKISLVGKVVPSQYVESTLLITSNQKTLIITHNKIVLFANIANPETPTLFPSTIDLGEHTNSTMNFRFLLHPNGTLIAVLPWFSLFYNIDNPSEPKLLKKFETLCASPLDIALRDDTLFISDRPSTLTVSSHQTNLGIYPLNFSRI